MNRQELDTAVVHDSTVDPANRVDANGTLTNSCSRSGGDDETLPQSTSRADDTHTSKSPPVGEASDAEDLAAKRPKCVANAARNDSVDRCQPSDAERPSSSVTQSTNNVPPTVLNCAGNVSDFSNRPSDDGRLSSRTLHSSSRENFTSNSKPCNRKGVSVSETQERDDRERTNPRKRARTCFEHSRRLRGNLDNFQIRSADDILSVISEESLSSVATRVNGSDVEPNQNPTSTLPGQVSPSSSYQQLEDPWVRTHDTENTSASLNAAPAPNPLTPNRSTGAIPQEQRIQAEAKTVFESRTRNRIRFRSESQEELDTIERNNRVDWSATSAPPRTNEDRERDCERSDMDWLTRPSWCDARFALSRIEQGKASGNKAALKLRAFFHLKLFWIGCHIQRHATTVCFVGLLALAACTIGLKFAHMETNIEKLWVESGGKLEEELKYTKAAFATSDTSDGSGFSSGGYADSSTKGGTGYSYQMLIQTGLNTLSVESLKLHLEIAIEATKVTVAMYNQTWGFSDVCYKENLPLHFESDSLVSSVLERLFPCFIITPLDCFWEGAKLLGPNPPISFYPLTNGIAWTNFNPLELLDKLRDDYDDHVKYFQDVLLRAGITSGYTERWCLDPYDPECPKTSPNYDSKEVPNLSELFSAGCSGFATKFMQWPLDLIVGGVQRNSERNVTKARGLQTLFSLMGVKNMYEFHTGINTGSDWSLSRAEAILQNWERKFAAKIYELAEKEKVNSNSTDDLYAFTVTTTSDILAEFSKISFIRLIGGCVLMMGYACISLMRSRASRSQGAVGILGVLLVILSVAGGLGICSVIGISFNAASTQVLPFLLLGLGVDDMFLMAHHFGEISVLTHIPFEERTGECLKRVGVSVFLTSVAILSGFLFSLIIPMPALRAFGLQATIVTAFNLVSVLIIYPAILSLDLIRRGNNKLDIFFCFDSSTVNEVTDLRRESRAPEVYDPTPVVYYQHRSAPVINSPSPGGDTHLPGQVCPDSSEATFTMQHTIQAFANDSFVLFKHPTESTMTGGVSSGPQPPSVPPYNSSDRVPRTPPPQYSASAQGPNIVRPRLVSQRNRVAFVNDAMSEPSTTGHSTPATGGGSGRTSRRGGYGSGPPTNLTTPMESVRGSTHSLVAVRRGHRKPNWYRNCFGRCYSCMATLPKFTLSQLGERYYAPFLLRNPVRIAVIVLFLALIGLSVYGVTIVRDGLDFGDILPRGTREHSAVVAQTTYFSFQNMYIVTKTFDYAANQKNLQLLHDSMGDLDSYVMRNTDGSLNKFWLEYFREWLLDLQDEFDAAWLRNEVNSTTWTPQASDKTVLAFKLLGQTGKADDYWDSGRIGCRPPSANPCTRVNIVRLVSDDGVIPEDAFYNYLSAWVGNDPLTYSASEAQIRPAPQSWFHNRDVNMVIPRSSDIYFAQMPFYLNNMRETEDYVNVINWVRSMIENVESTTGVRAYPNGYPFLFWQQYITLRFWLLISLVCVIFAVFLVLSVVLFNPWAAGIMALLLAMIATELFGFMGLAGVKLSAVPAVILVASIGLGVEFTVHVTFAFVTSCGSRRERVYNSIGHMLGPVIDGSISTLLGVLMLVVAEFDFIIIYFFQVLAALLLLGILNGLVLLPVILSLIGPPSEVIPVGGGSRLKTPTPPPSPTMQMEYGHPGCDRYDLPRAPDPGFDRYYYQRRHTTHQHSHRNGGRFSSRDDSYSCPYHHRCRSQRATYRQPPTSIVREQQHRFAPPRGNGEYVRSNFVQRRGDFDSSRDSSMPPGDDDRTRVVFYPRYLVSYSSGNSPPNEPTRDRHCENDSTKAQTEIGNEQTLPGGSHPMPTLTATSSLTVKVHGRQPMVAVVDAPSTSGVYPHPPDPDGPIPCWEKGQEDGPVAFQPPSSNRRFDISVLNERPRPMNSDTKS